MTWDEQELRGAGPGYQVRFDDRGFEFWSEGDATIRGATESVGRRADGAVEAHPVARGLPVANPHGVSYRRGCVVERYDLRADGVELSYVFDELPRGAGDLVVRVQVATTLGVTATKAHVDTLSFVAGERPIISVGVVTGADAKGRRVQGSMTFEDGILELALPEDFVEAASLPLVLDPVFGSSRYRTNGGGFHRNTAYDPVSDVFVVVMNSVLTSPNYTPVAQLLSPRPLPGLLGPPIVIGQFCCAGDVASVAARGRFLVSYGDVTTPYLRTLDPATGTMSPPVVTPGVFLLSGDMSSKGQALGVLVQGTSLSVAAVDVDAMGNVSVQKTVLLTNALEWVPDVSASCGVNGRHMVVWTECTGQCLPGKTNRDIWGAIIGRDGVVLEKRPIASTGRDEFCPHVDGDGNQWLVSYSVKSPQYYGDVEGAIVFWDSNAGRSYTGRTLPLGVNPYYHVLPAPIVFTGASYLTGWYVPAAAGGQVWTQALVDAIDGSSLELATTHATTAEALGASQHWRRGGTGDVALLVDGDTAYWYRVNDGLATDLGGGCGRGGHIGVSGALSQANFTSLHLRDARPTVPAVLIVGSTAVNVSCGQCTLVPDPATVITPLLGVTDSHGNTQVRVPVANLFGVTFIEQWATLGGNACSLGVEFSNAVQVQIQ